MCGRTHDFQNTLRQINLKRGPSWLAHAINFVSDRIVGVDLTPQPVVSQPHGHYVTVACSPGSLTVAVSSESWARVCRGVLAVALCLDTSHHLPTLLTATGRVHCIGSNDHGQCGLGYVSPSVYAATSVPGFGTGAEEGPVVRVSAGFQHVLAATEDGALFGWGRGDRGQLGLADREAYKSPLRVLGRDSEIAERSVVDVATGFSNSAIVTSDGVGWVFGKMQSDETTVAGRQMADALLPRRVPLGTEAKPVAVTCGQAHVCFLTGEWCSCGFCLV